MPSAAGGWARRWPERYRTIENADGLGHHLAQWLISRSETVVDLPPTPTAKIRTLSRGGRRKNDPIDAAAAARVAAIRGEREPTGRRRGPHRRTRAPGRAATHLSRHRTRLLNQLPALLRDTDPGRHETLADNHRRRESPCTPSPLPLETTRSAPNTSKTSSPTSDAMTASSPTTPPG
ncbi:IS110 family transposase [Nocardia testacea]|uniref:IS110 family transposase n=1 Tax=Nocardia testacea TaxID=248551 RepID=UPI003A879AD9